MMSIKTFSYLRGIALLLLGLALASPAAAQRQRNPERFDPAERMDRHLQRLDKVLDLTDAQEAQIREVMAAHREEARAWHEARPEATREERQVFRTEQHEEMRAALEGILTAEQQKIFAGVVMGRFMGEGHRRGGAGHHRGAFLDRLDLTEAQETQIREIMAAHREEGRAWAAAHPDATREERQAYRQEHAAALKAAIEAVLTPEQREQFRSRQNERGDGMGMHWKGKERGQGQPGARNGGQGANAARSGSAFSLENYPNPFNPTTEIRFELPASSMVNLTVYDTQGREVRRLLNEELGAGNHTATFEATGLPSGVYLYRLTAGAVTETGRMTLAK